MRECFLLLCHLHPTRAATVARQRRDGRLLQKLPGQKQNTTRQLQQVSCFAVWRLPRCRFVSVWVGRTSPGTPSLQHLSVWRATNGSGAKRLAGWSRFGFIKPPERTFFTLTHTTQTMLLEKFCLSPFGISAHFKLLFGVLGCIDHTYSSGQRKLVAYNLFFSHFSFLLLLQCLY